MTFKTRFSQSERVVSPVGVEPAQQQFKDDADINSIMRRFHKTGAIDHVAAHQPRYGFANSQTLHEAMNIVAQADSMFADLPSPLKRKFNGNPAELLEFVQDPANEAEAKELGLALSDEAAAKAAELQEAAKREAEAGAGGQEPAAPAQSPPSN